MLVGKIMLTFINMKVCDIKQVSCNPVTEENAMKGYLMSIQKSHN
jgi:hypothetical protein